MKKLKLFLIDDNEINHIIIESYCKDLDLEIKAFLDAKEALDTAKIDNPDIIITDYIMPSMDGIEFIHNFRRNDRKTPIILITSAEEKDIKIKALEAGATEFLPSPLDRLEFRIRVRNLLELRKYQNLVEDKVELLKSEIEKATKTILKREKETLDVLVETARKNDSDTGNHIVRVAEYAKLLSCKLGMSKAEQEEIYYAAQLHDLGKIGISDSILNKSSKLSDEEYNLMKTHSQIGYDILKNRESEYLKRGSIVALSHHERYDGSGYPNGLRGKEIPVEGRIVAIADVFDALLMKRSYKKEWSIEEAISYIQESRGSLFDPDLVDLFIDSIEEITEISKKLKD